MFLGGLAQLARAPALQAGGQRFESVILHQRHSSSVLIFFQFKVGLWVMYSAYWIARKIFDILIQARLKVKRVNQDNILKVRATVISACLFGCVYIFRCDSRKVNKGVWRMPRLTEAMKDVISCDKLRVGANDLWSVDFRMGQPKRVKHVYLIYIRS